jgi:Paraquat-inducible protein A
VLLLASDIGSGVSAYRKLVNPYVPSQNDNTAQQLLHASVFTSITKLWNTGSYALAILIVVASISWPFVKIFLSLYAWCVPFTTTRSSRRRRSSSTSTSRCHCRRRPCRGRHQGRRDRTTGGGGPAVQRERLLEVIDALGKWSFVDIVVFTEIVVAFRSTIDLGGPYVEIYIVPEWGLVGFVAANMLILVRVYYYRSRNDMNVPCLLGWMDGCRVSFLLTHFTLPEFYDYIDWHTADSLSTSPHHLWIHSGCCCCTTSSRRR